ncbi:MAG: hypothetical protein JW726_15020 [Anaerolineales bacterium]|nr:hypothetical protein [Anaerolineales bacterium]
MGPADERLFVDEPPAAQYLPLLERSSPPAWIGPTGGTVVSVVVDPLNPEIAYAGTWGAGVYKSRDGGITWEPASEGLGNLYIYSLAVNPQQPLVLYAGVYKDQLYKSTDGGQSWFASSAGIQPETTVYTIAIDPLNPQIIYIGTRGPSNEGAAPWNGVLYKSDDGGETWEAKLENVGREELQDWIYSIAISPNPTSLVYAAAHERAVFRSTDFGETWKGVAVGITDESGRAIVIQPDAEDVILYFGTWHGGGVFKSVDGGENWEVVSASLPGVKIVSMAHDNLHPGTLYLATSKYGVVKTMDGGETWHGKGLAEQLIYMVAIDPQDGQNLLAGTANNGLFRSGDGGETWAHSQEGLHNAWVNGLVTDVEQRGLFYAGLYGNGVWRSSDGGQTWEAMNNGLPEKYIQALVSPPWQPGILYALTQASGLFRCDVVSGPCWQAIAIDGLAGLGSFDVVHRSFAGRSASAGRSVSALPLLPGIEEDGRVTDLPLQELETPSVTGLLSMAFSPSYSATAYLGTDGLGVWRSENGGLSWEATDMTSQSIHALAVHPSNPEIVFAATEPISDVWVTMNEGEMWMRTNLPAGEAFSLAASANRNEVPTGTLTSTGTLADVVLYAGTSHGVYRWDEAGWTALGLEEQTVTALAVSAEFPNRIYAGTLDGAYVSRDGGQTWLRGPDELAGIAVGAIRIDPFDPFTVYYCTPTHGILRVRG